jgi:hypothetical protein
MIALLADHTFKIIFTLQAVLLLHLLRATGITLGAYLQMITWKIKSKTVNLYHYPLSAREKGLIWIHTLCFVSVCEFPADRCPGIMYIESFMVPENIYSFAEKSYKAPSGRQTR